jgi:uncharacterized membrane protein HdeD (DUF308 family)
MTENTGTDLLHHAWLSWVLFGLTTAILGVVLVAWPGPSILVASVLFGIYLVLSGLVMLFAAFTAHISGGARFLSFISGAASLVLGVLAFRQLGDGNAYIILLLAIWIAIGFVFRGIWAVGAATSHPGAPGRGWAIFFGVLSLIAGLVMLGYPFASLVVLAQVAGVWLIILGTSELISGIGIRREVTKAADHVKNIAQQVAAH